MNRIHGPTGAPVDEPPRRPPPGEAVVATFGLTIGILLMVIQLWLLTIAFDLYLEGARARTVGVAAISGLVFLGGLAMLRLLDRRPAGAAERAAMARPDRPREPLPTGPIGGHLAAVVGGLLVRFRLSALAARHDSTAVLAAFGFVNGCLSIGLMAAVALVTGRPFIFPSLGPTAFLFFYTPLAPAASPRNACLGHLIGALAGWGCLLAFGLQGAGSSIASGVTLPRVGAAALSLGLTSGLMVLARTPHPPAGATTLIFSLGVLRGVGDVVVLMVAVALLTLQAAALNRLAGLPYPLWAPTPDRPAANAPARPTAPVPPAPQGPDRSGR